ncbi:hypothetical protein AB0I54_31665 [Streptomyces sp. NPDC050625]|uniref:hypothetical protein n=1 Tax=Streptomyces sp. NPDC050625 TaxID=3154629 RepID=UPI003425444F
MIIVYAPEDGQTHRWDLKTARILATEAEAVERVTDLDWATARSKVVKGSMLALRAIAWVLLKRSQPALRYTQFDPAAGELGFEYDADERAVIRANIETDEDLTEEERAGILAELDEADAALDAAETAEHTADDPEQVPKASGDEASPTAA